MLKCFDTFFSFRLSKLEKHFDQVELFRDEIGLTELNEESVAILDVARDSIRPVYIVLNIGLYLFYLNRIQNKVSTFFYFVFFS